MAYTQDFLQDDDEKKKELSSSGPSIGAPGSEAGTAGTDKPTSPTGTGFVNLQDYVAANKDQSAAMADKFVAPAVADTQAARDAQNQFKFASRSAANKGVYEDVLPVETTLMSDPAKFSDPTWRGLFQKATAGYQAPPDLTTLPEYGSALSSTTKASESSAALSDPSRISAGLDKLFGGPGTRYTAGMNTLDTFLTGSGEGGERISRTAEDLKKNNVSDTWKAALDESNQFVKNAAERADTNAKVVRDLRDQKAKFYEDLFNQQSSDASSWGKRLGDYANPADIAAYTALQNLVGKVSGFNFAKSPAPEVAPAAPVKIVDPQVTAKPIPNNKTFVGDTGAVTKAAPIAIPKLGQAQVIQPTSPTLSQAYDFNKPLKDKDKKYIL